MQQFKRTVLERGWQMQEASSTAAECMPVEKVPTVVHLDLLANGKYVQLTKDNDEDMLSEGQDPRPIQRYERVGC